jgi:hypothetical protein
MIIAFIILIGLVIAAAFDLNHLNRAVGDVSVSSSKQAVAETKVVTAPPSPCTSNTLNELIVVGIDQQHLWACNFSTTSYSTPVVTGYSGLAADITPVGSYQIFTKETDVNLTGTDGVTSWNVHVSYWMPFLFNQYGAYGFHDATWRTPSQFGNILPTSPNASHGCIEMPLAGAHWLFDWASVGTQIKIEQSA